VKVAACCAGLLSLGLFAANWNSGRLIRAIFYGLAFADSLLISHNCYIKTYIGNAVRKLGPIAIAETAIDWLAGFIGLNDSKSSDSSIISRLKNDIIWEVIYGNTITLKLFRKVI